MQNALTKSKPYTSQQSNTRREAASLKIIVFQVGDLNLAMPAKNVYRVLKTPAYGGRLNSVGIVHVGDRVISVLDLYWRLFQSSITNQGSQKLHLVVAENKEGELYGIPTTAVPALIRVPLDSMQVLPDSYRHTNILEMATHYCHVSGTEEQSMTIFLLDIERLMV